MIRCIIALLFFAGCRPHEPMTQAELTACCETRGCAECALALPAVFSEPMKIGNQRRDDASVLRMLSTLYRQGDYTDKPRSKLVETLSGVILIVYDGRDLAGYLRSIRLHAYQLSRFAGLSKWSIQGTLENNPIRHATIHIAWHLDAMTNMAALFEIMWTVREGGFLIVDAEREGNGWITAQGFAKVNFEWGPYQIWRKQAA